MASLLKDASKLSVYRDRSFSGSQEEYDEALSKSTTAYIGNMSFYTTEEQVYELFSRSGEVKKVVMGLDRNTKTPCGFCFVMFYSREDTEDAVKYVSGTMLDGRLVRVDFDWGFQQGRQWGRGKSGGQVRDEHRIAYDPCRGGYGKSVQVVAAADYDVPRDSGRKRGRRPDEQELPRRSYGKEAKNPRFREHDSDDEEECEDRKRRRF